MAGAVMNKILDLFGVEGDTEEEENDLDSDYEYENEIEEETEENRKRGIFRNKVVSMPQVQQIKMKIAKPTTFEQSEDICNLLKEKNSIVVNLEYVNKDVARRIVDFISGAVHALDGHIEKVSNSIFVVAPCNYNIVNDMMSKEDVKNKLSVSWLK